MVQHIPEQPAAQQLVTASQQTTCEPSFTHALKFADLHGKFCAWVHGKIEERSKLFINDRDALKKKL